MIINGESYDFQGVSLLTILEELSLNPQVVVAEVNGEIVPRRAFERFVVDKSAVVELVAFVGGG